MFVFVHGAGGSPESWRMQRDLGVAVDLHKNPQNSIDLYVEDVKNFLKRNHYKNVTLVGHSMGGAITQKFALKYPEFLKGIVLVGTGAKLRVHPTIFETIEQDYRKAIDLILEWAFSKKTDRKIVEASAKEMLKVPPEITYNDFLACDKFDIMNEVEKINLKTLIVCGLDDKLTPPKYSEYLSEKIKNSELVFIEDAGHMVMIEKPKEFNKILKEFEV